MLYDILTSLAYKIHRELLWLQCTLSHITIAIAPSLFKHGGESMRYALLMDIERNFLECKFYIS
jgi:hypothetical protein